MNSFQIIGIQSDQPQTNENYIPNVARVRMFVGDQIIDEDFELPEIPPNIPKTTENYQYFLKDAITARMTELEEQNE